MTWGDWAKPKPGSGGGSSIPPAGDALMGAWSPFGPQPMDDELESASGRWGSWTAERINELDEMKMRLIAASESTMFSRHPWLVGFAGLLGGVALGRGLSIGLDVAGVSASWSTFIQTSVGAASYFTPGEMGGRFGAGVAIGVAPGLIADTAELVIEELPGLLWDAIVELTPLGWLGDVVDVIAAGPGPGAGDFSIEEIYQMGLY